MDETEAFVRVVRAGGFAEAGRRSLTPRSTLSRQIQRLEDSLGVRLLQRTTRRVALTETGEAYFRRCAPAVDAILQARREALAASSEPRGTLTIACPFDFSRDWLAPLLPRFHELFPEIELRIRVSPRRVDLVGEGVDVAIRGGMLNDSSLIARRIAHSSLVMCATPAYLAEHGHPEQLADLADHATLTFAGPPRGWEFTGPAGNETVSEAGWLQINEWGTLRLVTLASTGIGLIEIHVVSKDIREGRLVRVLPRYEVRAAGAGLFAVFPAAQQLSPKVRVFVDFLLENKWPQDD